MKRNGRWGAKAPINKDAFSYCIDCGNNRVIWWDWWPQYNRYVLKVWQWKDEITEEPLLWIASEKDYTFDKTGSPALVGLE
jgi:hypothetical protein